jgi:hypothetical protein
MLLPYLYRRVFALAAGLVAPPGATSRMRSTVLKQIGQASPTDGSILPLMQMPQ